MADSLDSYFDSDEIGAAEQLVQIFHGRLLLNNELGRANQTLIGVYMFSNSKKESQVGKAEVKQFVTNDLGVAPETYSKGLYDLKESGMVSEIGSGIAITFKGLSEVRKLLAKTG
jgi:hypothetical protein